MAARRNTARRRRTRAKSAKRPAAAKARPQTGARARAAPARRGGAAAATPSSAPSAPRTLPDVEVETTGGRRLRLAELRGTPVVLYFYPKDDTPGCTAEGCAIRDRFAEFRALGAVVLGVSRDSLASHERFKAKYGFPFELVSDPDERLCRLFGVLRTKSLYGRPYRGIDRSTFVYDRHGVLRREFRGVKVRGHVQELLAELAALPQQS